MNMKWSLLNFYIHFYTYKYTTPYISGVCIIYIHILTDKLMLFKINFSSVVGPVIKMGKTNIDQSKWKKKSKKKVHIGLFEF